MIDPMTFRRRLGSKVEAVCTWCPISHEIMRDPVATHIGHVYERAPITCHMVSAWEVLRHRLQLRLRAGGSATNAVSRRIPPRLQGAPNKRKLATSDTFEDALWMLEARHEQTPQTLDRDVPQ